MTPPLLKPDLEVEWAAREDEDVFFALPPARISAEQRFHSQLCGKKSNV